MSLEEIIGDLVKAVEGLTDTINATMVQKPCECKDPVQPDNLPDENEAVAEEAEQLEAMDRARLKKELDVLEVKYSQRARTETLRKALQDALADLDPDQDPEPEAQPEPPAPAPEPEPAPTAGRPALSNTELRAQAGQALTRYSREHGHDEAVKILVACGANAEDPRLGQLDEAGFQKAIELCAKGAADAD